MPCNPGGRQWQHSQVQGPGPKTEETDDVGQLAPGLAGGKPGKKLRKGKQISVQKAIQEHWATLPEPFEVAM